MQGSIPFMATKVKIAVSLSPEVLELLDRHADGRSRSQSIEQELLTALRAREWERLSAACSGEEVADQVQWAESSLLAVEGALGPQESRAARAVQRKRSRR